MKDERVKAAGVVGKKPPTKALGDEKQILDDLSRAVYGSKLVSYAQGFVLMREASKQHKWDLK
jgi:6-phosphogluconate dehydrogenase